MNILSQINKQINLENSYIISYKRTPFGSFLGELSQLNSI